MYTSDRLLCVASSARASGVAVSDVGVAVFPRIHGYFSGVGDLFSALVLAHFEAPVHPSPKFSSTSSSPSPLADSTATPVPSAAPALLGAVSAALATTQAILLATHEHSALQGTDCPPTDDELDEAEPDRRVRRMRARELRIVQGIDVIRAPPRGLVAVESWGAFWA